VDQFLVPRVFLLSPLFMWLGQCAYLGVAVEIQCNDICEGDTPATHAWRSFYNLRGIISSQEVKTNHTCPMKPCHGTKLSKLHMNKHIPLSVRRANTSLAISTRNVWILINCSSSNLCTSLISILNACIIFRHRKLLV
jgi:hypothetical protein